MLQIPLAEHGQRGGAALPLCPSWFSVTSSPHLDVYFSYKRKPGQSCGGREEEEVGRHLLVTLTGQGCAYVISFLMGIHLNEEDTGDPVVVRNLHKLIQMENLRWTRSTWAIWSQMPCTFQ